MATVWNLLLAMIAITIARAESNCTDCQDTKAPSQPKISEGYREFLAGETFVMNCTVDYESNCALTLEWTYPPTCPNDTISEETNEYNITEHAGILYRTIKIVNATKAHEGRYTCISKNNCGNKYISFYKTFLDEPYLEAQNLNDPTGKKCLESKRVINLSAQVQSYPPATVSYFIHNTPLPKNSTKYTVSRDTNDWILTIKQVYVADSANYTLVANNGYMNKTVVFCVRVKAPPNITFGNTQDIRKDRGVMTTFECTVTGIPLPDIQWIFTSEEDNREEIMESTAITENSVYQETAYLTIPVKKSGNITCHASNVPARYKEERYVSRRLLVYELPGGFGIWNKYLNEWFPENRDVVVTCMASKYDFINVTWIGSYNIDEFVENSNNSLSLVTKLKLNQISVSQSGAYVCRGVRNDGTFQDDTIFITVEAVRPPVIFEPSVDRDEQVILLESIQLPCHVNSVPPPTLEWFKDDQKLENTTKARIYLEKVNVTNINSTIEIARMAKELVGTYKCVATSDGIVTERIYKLALKEESNVTLLCVILVVIAILILIVAYLSWKIRKEKRFRKELAAAGLLYFKEGVTKSLNPELGIDEQAELLPYDEKFEFPYENLKLGKQLGSGAFGVVYKAEARGIINAEETTDVAVKMVKKTADNMYIKALASELKIMVHMGKHVNIVNLLGACTKNVGKRELVVIVEYCKFGNIHNYLLRHRDVFIDQLTDNTEKSLGKVNRGYSCSSGSAGMQSDYFGSNTQDTDHTFLNTANTSRGGRKVSEGYVQPEWRTNYESDYSFDGRAPRQLFSRDLLAWAFQIARGMEYLASRKVLHGDLAARNVLLADDNIVKICDFGLARSIYKDDEYQKKENSLLPVKWLAIECMTDRIFSTQSDVWSFGIVLWELFSLAKTPYPNISPAELLQFLSKGERLEKPTYADDKLYNIMKRCWAQKPTQRPSFSELQEILGGFLEDNVRNHYVDLNSAYTDVNPKPGEEDYLAMVAAPDYNNLVTPSPHHYVNEERFFPPGPTAQLDDEGYLQMSPVKQSIFSPRFQETKFDFDSRHPRVPEPSHSSSELTPMLTLNNLPTRSGSESDHEGNASPYLNMCPKIVEESDEVFVTTKTPELDTKQNNEKNAARTGVTNRMYIPFGIDNKPKDIINNYSNIPNGLVK